MSNEAQEQSDSQENQTVVDPLDATNSTNSGTNELDAYQALINGLASDDLAPITELGQESADDEVENGEQYDESDFDEESEQTNDDPDEEQEEEEEEPEKPTSKRFRLNSDEDIAVAALAKARKISLVAAAAIYSGAPAAVATQTAESQTQEPAETAATIAEQIKALRAEKLERYNELDYEAAAELETKIDELSEKRSDLKLQEARNQSIKESAEETKFYADFRESDEKAVMFYPDLAKKGSPIQKEFIRLQEEMKELGDDLYYSSDKPLILAKKAAYNLKIPMAKPEETAQVKKSVQNRPNPTASGNARTASTTATQAVAQKIAGLASMDDYEKLLAGVRG